MNRILLIPNPNLCDLDKAVKDVTSYFEDFEVFIDPLETDTAYKCLDEKMNSFDVVVLGLPKNMDNTMGFDAERSLNFKKSLEEENIKVELQDERLTSVEAINIMKNNGLKQINKKNKTDIISATLILEAYLKKVNYGK